MIIKILGVGCSKCEKVEKNVRKAVEELGIDATIEKVEDLKEIVSYGVMNAPAIVVDEKVKMIGKIPSVKEIKKIL
jgi:small redox-active disulfide protein 2